MRIRMNAKLEKKRARYFAAVRRSRSSDDEKITTKEDSSAELISSQSVASGESDFNSATSHEEEAKVE